MADLRITFTSHAIHAIDEILGFIARDNPSAASRLAQRMEKGLARMARFPGSGRKIPEAPHRNEQELVIPPSLRIVCRAEGGVLWVLHAMRAEQAFRADIFEDCGGPDPLRDRVRCRGGGRRGGGGS